MKWEASQLLSTFFGSSHGWVQTSPSVTTAVTASWTPGTDLSSQLIHFYSNGTCSTAILETQTLLGSDSSYAWGAPGEGTFSYKIVSTHNISGMTKTSNCSSPMTIDYAPMAATSLNWLEASPQNGTVTARWNPSTDTDIVEQKVILYTAGCGTALNPEVSVTIGDNSISSATFTPPEGTYAFKVVGKDGAGNATASACSSGSGMVIDQTAPDVTTTTVTITSGSPTSNSNLPLSYSSVPSHSKYCVLLNDSDVSHCSFTSSAFPSSYASAGDGSKTLHFWFQDAAGNVSGRVSTNTVVLDTTGPVPTGAVTATVSPAGSVLSSSHTLTLTIPFDEAVTVSGGSPYLSLSVGGTSVFAYYVSGSGSLSLSFSYTPTSPHSGSISLSSASIQAGGATFTDSLGNSSSSLSFTAPDLSGLTVDAAPPDVTWTTASIAGPSPTNSTSWSLNVSSAPTDTAYYCKKLDSTDPTGCNWISGTPPNLSAHDMSAESDGSHSFSFWFKDSVGNISSRVMTNSIVLDRVAPAAPLSLRWAEASPTNATALTAQWSTTADVNQVTLKIYSNDGCSSAPVHTASGIPASDASFSFDSSASGGPMDSITYSFKVTAFDAAGNSTDSACSSTFTNVGSEIYGAVLIDRTAPSIASVEAPSGAFRSGQVIRFKVSWSEPVVVGSGGPTLGLTLAGGGVKPATLESGSGTDTWVFAYLVVTGDPEGAVTGSGTISGGTVVDLANNPASSLSHTGLSPTGVSIDQTGPTIASVTASPSGTYTTGSQISFIVNWSENAYIATGTPKVVLTLSGGATRNAVLITGAGTNSWIFAYSVQSGDPTGTVISDSFISGGAVRDPIGNVATSLNHASLTLTSVSISTAESAKATNLAWTTLPPHTSKSLAVSWTRGSSVTAQKITLYTGGSCTGSVAVATSIVTTGASSGYTHAFSGSTLRNGGVYNFHIQSSTDGTTWNSTNAVCSSPMIIRALNIEVPIELADTGLRLPADPGGDTTLVDFWNTQTSLNPNAYDGVGPNGVSYFFEVVAVNLNSLSTSHVVALMDESGGIQGSVELRTYLGAATLIREPFTSNTPPAGIYRVSLGRDGATNGELKVLSARIVVQQVGATRTRVYIPLLSDEHDSAKGNTGNEIIRQTSNSYSDGTHYSNEGGRYYHHFWRKSTTAIPASSKTWTLETVTLSDGNKDAAVALINTATGNMVLRADNQPYKTFTTIPNSPQLNTVIIPDSATNFAEGKRFAPVYASPGTGSAANISIYKVGLWLGLDQVDEVPVYYRVSKAVPGASSIAVVGQRLLHDWGGLGNWTASTNQHTFCNHLTGVGNTLHASSNSFGPGGTTLSASYGAAESLLTYSGFSCTQGTLTGTIPEEYLVNHTSITAGRMTYGGLLKRYSVQP